MNIDLIEMFKYMILQDRQIGELELNNLMILVQIIVVYKVNDLKSVDKQLI